MQVNEDTEWSNLVACFIEGGVLPAISKTVYRFKDEVKTVRSVHGKARIREALASWLDRLPYATKDNEDNSERYRIAGNEKLKTEKSAAGAALLYTKAIYKAPNNSKTLALAYGNRASALYKLGEYEAALHDCECALKLSHPNIELMLRKQNTIQQALQKKMAQKGNQISAQTKDSLVHQANGTDDSIFKKNQRIQRNANFGRFIVADELINRNELIMTERPFAFVPVHDDLGSQYPINHYYMRFGCDNCSESNIIPIPCSECRHVYYCSLKCRDENKHIHKIECNGFKINLFIQLGNAHLAFRCLLIVFDQIIKKLKQQMNRRKYQKAEEIWSRITQMGKDGDLMGLCTNYKHLESKTILVSHALGASMLCCYLVNKSSFFEDTRDRRFAVMESRLEWEIVISALLFRLTNQMLCNAQSIEEMSVAPFTRLVNVAGSASNVVDHKILFIAVYPHASLYNHSCEPNAIVRFEGGKVSIIALKPIVKGQEITICYGKDFKEQCRIVRRRILEERYGFFCNCVRCQDPHDLAYAKYRQLICKDPSCGYVYLIENGDYCPQCRSFSDIIEKTNAFLVTVIPNLVEHFRYVFEEFKKINSFLPDYTTLRLKWFCVLFSTYLAVGDRSIYNDEKIDESILRYSNEYMHLSENIYGVDSLDFVERSTVMLDVLAVRKREGLKPVKLDYNMNKVKFSFSMLPVKIRGNFEEYFDMYASDQIN